MSPRQRIVRERRQYNQWVASETLEDYALRYTAERARKSSFRVGSTALGPISFLACEAIGGGITIAYGFANAAWAIVAFVVLMFFIGLPIAYHAAKAGVDIDLLTRGAGFGYMGSTITSLIYASFTFLLFAIEASILSMALHMMLDMPLWIAHLISSLAVIPIAIYGISFISKMQIATQPIWLVLQFVPIAYLALNNPSDLEGWTQDTGRHGKPDGVIDLAIEFGELSFKGLQCCFDGALNALIACLPVPIGLHADHLDHLATACDQVSQGLAVSVRKRTRLGTDPFRK